jgi:hypothetical protein
LDDLLCAAPVDGGRHQREAVAPVVSSVFHASPGIGGGRGVNAEAVLVPRRYTMRPMQLVL